MFLLVSRSDALVVCALFAWPIGCASEIALPKNEIKFVLDCCLHATLYQKHCKQFFSISWWSYTNQTKKIYAYHPPQGGSFGPFFPHFCVLLLFYVLLFLENFNLFISNLVQMTCYTLTVTRLKSVMSFCNLGCFGGHFGYVSLFLFLRNIQLFNIFSLRWLPHQKKLLQYFPLCWEPYWGILDKFFGTFLCFLKTVQCYLIKFCTYIRTKKIQVVAI